MAALTKLTLYNKIRSLLGDNPWHDICTEAMDTTETGLDVADTTKYAIGNVVEFQDDGELCLVTALPSGTTLTVIRNYLYSVGTTAGTGTSHSISADIVVDPTFKYVDITRSLEQVVTGLWPHVWVTPTTVSLLEGSVAEITPIQGTRWYDFGGAYQLEIFEIGMVTQVVSTSPKKVARYGVKGGYPIALSHNLDSDIAPTGFVGLYFHGIQNYTYPIRVAMIEPIKLTQTTPGTYDYLDDNTSAANCLMYLTASRLVETSAVTRLTQADVSMGDATIGTNARLQLSSYLMQRGIQERNKWSQHCRTVWPKLPYSRFFKNERDIGGMF
jgi:hypothetical protein